MIHTAKQLKDKVKNLATGKSDVAQMLIRIFIMDSKESQYIISGIIIFAGCIFLLYYTALTVIRHPL